jgi:hypothetical protein
MRLEPMTDTGHCPDPHHHDSVAGSLTHIRPTLHAQRLTIMPLKSDPDGMGNDGLQDASVPSFHVENGPTIRYDSQLRRR